MGMIEEKIKEQIMSEIYSEVTNVYDYIENKFELTQNQQDEIIKSLNNLNSDLLKILKEAKLQ
jgi:molecular chaperone GrpE (heat shock protein)